MILTSLVLTSQLPLVLNGLDPIDLIQGREVPGEPELSSTLGRHTYRFASQDHLELFKRDPYSYGVQNGGACGKMGATTGKGSPERWAVVEGKIYLFASDGCRTTFLANQASYFRQRRPVPFVTRAEQDEAIRRHKAMLIAHGSKQGAKVEWTIETPYSDSGTAKIWKTKGAYWGLDRFAHWEQWDAGVSYFIAGNGTYVEGDKNANFAVHPGERREFRAQANRNPLFIAVGGGGKPVRPESDGFTMVDGDIVTRVRVDSANRIIGLDFEDIWFGPVSRIEVEYSGYKTIAGFSYPSIRRARRDGGPWGAETKIAEVVVNGKQPSIFEFLKPLPSAD
ncbi:MAG: hypothetical protein JNK63_03580 [Chthonomonas sp.]|nr:hypothetical protein [Chthonomonas sp.]